LEDGAEGREEAVLTGVSARVLISERSDSVARKIKKIKKKETTFKHVHVPNSF